MSFAGEDLVDGPEAHTPVSPLDEAAVLDLRRRLAWAVARVCPRWLAHEREDLVQAATLRVLDLTRRGEVSDVPPTSYVLKVAHSVVLDEIRRRERRPREQAMTSAEIEPAAIAVQDQLRGARETGAAVLGCLRGLVPTRRRAVTLYLLGHPVPEAAARLGLAYKQANNLVFRGLADLRRCLAAKGITP